MRSDPTLGFPPIFLSSGDHRNVLENLAVSPSCRIPEKVKPLIYFSLGETREKINGCIRSKLLLSTCNGISKNSQLWGRIQSICL